MQNAPLSLDNNSRSKRPRFRLISLEGAKIDEHFSDIKKQESTSHVR